MAFPHILRFEFEHEIFLKSERSDLVKMSRPEFVCRPTLTEILTACQLVKTNNKEVHNCLFHKNSTVSDSNAMYFVASHEPNETTNFIK